MFKLRYNLLILFFIILLQPLFSQDEVNVECVYTYDAVEFLDAQGNSVDYQENAKGIIMFAEVEGQKYFCLTIGDETVFNATVSKSKVEDFDAKTFTKVYLCVNPFHNHTIPLQVFEIFDKSKSSFIPQSIVVQILHEDTAKVVQTQSYTGITRTR